MDDLIFAVENGLETGQFRSLSIIDNGKTILELFGSATEWSLTSDDTGLHISGELPTSMSGLFSFLEHLSKIPDFLRVEEVSYWDEETQKWIYEKSTPLGLSSQQRQEVIEGLRPYDIECLHL